MRSRSHGSSRPRARAPFGSRSGSSTSRRTLSNERRRSSATSSPPRTRRRGSPRSPRSGRPASWADRRICGEGLVVRDPMRLRLLLLGAIAAVAMAAAPAALAAGRNPQTAGLQVALRAQGLYRGPIDAISGPATVAAVRAFQRVQKLPVTGLADARTRKALGPLARPLFGGRTLHRGAFGWDVAVLQ